MYAILTYWHLADVVFESPFLVCAGSDRSTGWIKVFQLAADELMEDLNSSASLIKTVRFRKRKPGAGILVQEGLLDFKRCCLIYKMYTNTTLPKFMK